MTIGATLLFFDADWPRLIMMRFKSFNYSRPPLPSIDNHSTAHKRFITVFFTFWVGSQTLIPLPALIASNVKTAWHGHNDLFTWRMMLNNRAIYSQAFVAYIADLERIIFVPLTEYLSERQCYRVTARPNTTIQFAHYLKTHYQNKYEADDVKIHAYINTSINFREPELWADPTVNIADHDTQYGIHEWVQPVTSPLRSWYQYLDAPKYVQPTYADILSNMNIPQSKLITFDKVDASINDHITLPKCK